MDTRRFIEYTETRKNNFDFMRYALAALVILSHSWLLLDGDNSKEIFVLLSQGQISGGALAVNCFFIISGFLICNSWANDRRFSHYIKKRILRIYPGFLAAALICALVVGPLGHADMRQVISISGIAKLVGRIGLLSAPQLKAIFPHQPYPDQVNSSLWTIRLEFICYLMVPLLGVLGILKKRAACLTLLASSMVGYAVCLYVIPHAQNSPLLLGPEFGMLRLVVCFLAGINFYLWRDSIPYSMPAFACSVVLLAATFVTKGFPILFPICGTYALFYFAFSRSLDVSGFGKRGDLSYGTYLYAFPIQQLLVQQFGAAAFSPVTLFLVALPLTAIASALSWNLVEKPFLRKKPKATASAPIHTPTEPLLQLALKPSAD